MSPVEAAAGVPKGAGMKAGMSKGKLKALMFYKGKCKSNDANKSGKGKGTHPGDQNLPTPPASLPETIPDPPASSRDNPRPTFPTRKG